MNRDRLKGKAAVKYRIYDAVTESLKTSRSMEALKAALAARGIGMNITLNAEGKPKGVVFTCGNISFGGYQVDRSMTYAKLCQSLGMIPDGAGNVKGLTASDGRTEQSGFSFGRQPSDTLSETVEISEGMTSTETTTGDGVSSGGGIGEAIAELVMQPHVVQTGGGGGGNDRDWNDEDKEKNKKNPYKRRR